ncbi:MAG TPA: NAD(P)-dependent oxidoreductase [Xanthobacteraceae bacterium]|nr:NAD(P)-dependent oxidoreductase [Xanthobacteraceae bacterium]
MSDTTNPVQRTGVIGLGAMGLQMARHMAAKGFAVAGYDVAAAATAAAQRHGIRVCGSIAEVGDAAEVVVVMVATDAQVSEVVAGLLDRLARGAVVCIASSASPGLCRDLAARAAAKDIGVLDTPVVLGQEAANDGTLTIYVGGDAAAFARARPVLAAFGREVLHLGASGNGQIAKTINNLLLWACMTANFEALTLAKQLGADVPRLVAALGQGSGANWSLSRWGKGTGKWSEKDMDVALALAQDAHVPVPLAGLVDQLVKQINQEKMKALLA